MLQQFKKSLEQNGITLTTPLHIVKEYLSKTQNEMTVQDTINCFPEFYSRIRTLDLSDSGRKLVDEIVLDRYNPFEYDRAVSDLIGKVEYKYECDIKEMTLLELMFLVQFAHMYLGETSNTGVCPKNEAVKLINFNKTEVFAYRNLVDDLYYDGYIFQGKYDGDPYKQAQLLLDNGWVSEVRFIENNQQVSCWKSDSNPDELKVSKFHFFDDAGNYPDNYYSFWTHLEVEMLYDLKDMQTLLEIMEYIKDLPPKEDKRIEILGSSDEEEIPY